MLNNIVKNCDFIGISIKLKYEKRNKYKSLLGGLLSIIILCISLAATISFGWALIFNTNLNVSLSKSRQIQGFLNLTNNFAIMVGVSKRGGATINELQRYANISFVTYNLQKINGTPVKTIKYLNSRNCQSEDFNNMTDSFISAAYTSNMTYFSCLQQNQEMNIYGNIGSSNFTYLNILINKCINGTDTVCMPNTKIDELFKNLYLSIFFRDSYFESTNYTNPEQFYTNQFAGALSDTVYKRQYMYFKNVDFISDYGLVFEDKQKITTYQLDYIDTDLYFTKDAAFTSSTVLEISLTTKNIKDVYRRNYYKLQNLAADLGGVLKVVLLLCAFLNKLISEKIFNNEIYNQLFLSPISNIHNKDNKKNNNDIWKDPVIAQANNVYTTYKSENNKVDKNNYKLAAVNSRNILVNSSIKSIVNLKQKKIINSEISSNKYNNDNKCYKYTLNISSSPSHLKKKKMRFYVSKIFCFCFASKYKRDKFSFVNDTVDNLMDIRTILKNINTSNILAKYANKQYFTISNEHKNYQQLPLINTDILQISKDKSLIDYNQQIQSHLKCIFSSNNI